MTYRPILMYAPSVKRSEEREWEQVEGRTARAPDSASSWKGRFRPQDFIAVELYAHAQLAPRRIDRHETHHVTGASPLRGRSAAGLLWPFQKNLDRPVDNQRVV